MSYRILVVDEEPHLLELMKIVFEQDGFTVQSAKTPYEAMAQLLKAWPDAVIVGDLRPLSTASCNLVSDIRHAFGGVDTAIIMVSTQARPDNIRCGRAAGADEYLTKPFHMNSLLFCVQEQIARKLAG